MGEPSLSEEIFIKGKSFIVVRQMNISERSTRSWWRP